MAYEAGPSRYGQPSGNGGGRMPSRDGQPSGRNVPAPGMGRREGDPNDARDRDFESGDHAARREWGNGPYRPKGPHPGGHRARTPSPPRHPGRDGALVRSLSRDRGFGDSKPFEPGFRGNLGPHGGGNPNGSDPRRPGNGGPPPHRGGDGGWDRDRRWIDRRDDAWADHRGGPSKGPFRPSPPKQGYPPRFGGRGSPPPPSQRDVRDSGYQPFGGPGGPGRQPPPAPRAGGGYNGSAYDDRRPFSSREHLGGPEGPGDYESGGDPGPSSQAYAQQAASARSSPGLVTPTRAPRSLRGSSSPADPRRPKPFPAAATGGPQNTVEVKKELLQEPEEGELEEGEVLSPVRPAAMAVGLHSQSHHDEWRRGGPPPGRDRRSPPPPHQPRDRWNRARRGRPLSPGPRGGGGRPRGGSPAPGPGAMPWHTGQSVDDGWATRERRKSSPRKLGAEELEDVKPEVARAPPPPSEPGVRADTPNALGLEGGQLQDRLSMVEPPESKEERSGAPDHDGNASPIRATDRQPKAAETSRPPTPPLPAEHLKEKTPTERPDTPPLPALAVLSPPTSTIRVAETDNVTVRTNENQTQHGTAATATASDEAAAASPNRASADAPNAAAGMPSATIEPGIAAPQPAQPTPIEDVDMGDAPAFAVDTSSTQAAVNDDGSRAVGSLKGDVEISYNTKGMGVTAVLDIPATDASTDASADDKELVRPESADETMDVDVPIPNVKDSAQQPTVVPETIEDKAQSIGSAQQISSEAERAKTPRFQTLAERRSVQLPPTSSPLSSPFVDKVLRNDPAPTVDSLQESTDTEPWPRTVVQDDAMSEMSESEALALREANLLTAIKAASLKPRSGLDVDAILAWNRSTAPAPEPRAPEDLTEEDREDLLRRYVRPLEETQAATTKLIAASIAREKEEEQRKVVRLRTEYLQLDAEWREHCKQLDESMKRRGPPPEDLFALPSFLLPVQTPAPATPHEQETVSARAIRRSRGDAVASEAEYQQIFQALLAQEELKPTTRASKTTAVVPDMMTTRERHQLYDDDNDLVQDPLAYYDFAGEAEPIWTPEERATFMRRYLNYPKMFGRVADGLPNKTAADCVLYYYRTKKETDYKSTLAARRGQSKKKLPIKKGGKSAALLANMERQKPTADASAKTMSTTAKVSRDEANALAAVRRAGAGNGNARRRKPVEAEEINGGTTPAAADGKDSADNSRAGSEIPVGTGASKAKMRVAMKTPKRARIASIAKPPSEAPIAEHPTGSETPAGDSVPAESEKTPDAGIAANQGPAPVAPVLDTAAQNDLLPPVKRARKSKKTAANAADPSAATMPQNLTDPTAPIPTAPGPDGTPVAEKPHRRSTTNSYWSVDEKKRLDELDVMHNGNIAIISLGLPGKTERQIANRLEQKALKQAWVQREQGSAVPERRDSKASLDMANLLYGDGLTRGPGRYPPMEPRMGVFPGEGVHHPTTSYSSAGDRGPPALPAPASGGPARQPDSGLPVTPSFRPGGMRISALLNDDPPADDKSDGKRDVGPIDAASDGTVDEDGAPRPSPRFAAPQPGPPTATAQPYARRPSAGEFYPGPHGPERERSEYDRYRAATAQPSHSYEGRQTSGPQPWPPTRRPEGPPSGYYPSGPPAAGQPPPRAHSTIPVPSSSSSSASASSGLPQLRTWESRSNAPPAQQQQAHGGPNSSQGPSLGYFPSRHDVYRQVPLTHRGAPFEHRPLGSGGSPSSQQPGPTSASAAAASASSAQYDRVSSAGLDWRGYGAGSSAGQPPSSGRPLAPGYETLPPISSAVNMDRRSYDGQHPPAPNPPARDPARE